MVTRLTPARDAALRALEAVRRGALGDVALERCISELSPEDRRLAHELVYGVLRLRGRLDYLLSELVRGGIGRLQPEVLDALRLGGYQLLELDRVPDYAAVSESVEATRRRAGEGAAALVNAVLRRLSREANPERRFPRLEDDPVGHLSSWGSHPAWLVRRWLARWGPDEVARLVRHNNQRSSVYVTVLEPLDRAVERLRRAGLEAREVERAPRSLRIESADVERALTAIPAVIQDPAAAMVAEYAAPPIGETTLDACAAPGGKAAVLAALGRSVVALDVSRTRLGKLVENRRRLGLGTLWPVLGDATNPPVARAHMVLLDVPCTGTGTLGRHPDGRWRLGVDDLEALVALQRRLLDAAAGLVVSGGWLVYATCSIEPEENEEQVAAFLGRHEGFRLDPPRLSTASGEFLNERGELVVLPQRHGWDGAYAARFRRQAA